MISPHLQIALLQIVRAVQKAFCGKYGHSCFPLVLDGMATDQDFYAMFAYNRTLWNQNFLYDMADMTYNSSLLREPGTPLTFLFSIGYTVLCMMPLGLELWTVYQFRKASENL